MQEKPIRHASHILEEKSERFFLNCIPDNWVKNKINKDYGIDYFVDIVDKNNVTGMNFSVQLKGKNKELNKKFITIPIKRSTFNYWIARLEPILLIVYIEDENEGYFKWIHKNSIDLTRKNTTFRILIDRDQKLSKLNWEATKKSIEKIFNRKFLLENSEVDFFVGDNEKVAWKNYLQGNIELALHYFNIVLKTNESKFVLNAVAMCYYSIYDYTKALIYINKALKISNDEILFLNKASILVEDGILKNQIEKLEEAKKIFRIYINGSDEYQTHYNYANALSHLPLQEDWILAEKEYKISLNLNPNHAQAWKNLGSLYFKFEKYEEELNCYDKALILNAELPQALMSKGITLYKIFKKTKKGLEFMLKSYNIVGYNLPLRFPQGFFWIANAYFDLKDYDSCFNWITLGLDHNPADKYLINLQGVVYEKVWKRSKYKQVAKEFYIKYLNIYKTEYKYIYLISRIMKSEKTDDKIIYNFLSQYLVIFSEVNYEDFSKLNIKISNNLECIRLIELYANFRYTISIQDFNTKFDIKEDVDFTLFWGLLEIFLLLSFTNTYIYLSKNFKNENIINLYIQILLNNFLKYGRLITNTLFPTTELSLEAKSNIISKISIQFSEFLMKLATEMTGYIGGLFSLNKNELLKLNPNIYMNFYRDMILKIFIAFTKLIKK